MIRNEHYLRIGPHIQARIVYHVGDKVQGWYWSVGSMEAVGPFYNACDAELAATNWMVDNVRVPS